MKFSNSMLLILVLICSAFAQEPLNVDPKTICSWDEAAIIPGDLHRFSPDEETKAAVDKIMKYTGLQVNFELVAANVPTALAAMEGNRRVILYNQSFMQQIVRETGTDWASTSILAHEIAHHLNLHTLGVGGDRIKEELSADSFSGNILFRMGATLEQAKAAMESMPETTVPYYPKKSVRLAAIANGWIAAKELVSVQTGLPTPMPVPTPPVTGVAGTWSGEYTLLPNKGSRPTYIVFNLKQDGATIEGEMTFTNEAAREGRSLKVRGTYQENGDLDITSFPDSRDPITMHFNGHLPKGASSLSGKVVSADTRYQGNAQKKLTFPGIFSITRSSP